MQRFWSNHRWVRRLFYTLAGVLALCLAALVYVAYWYMPPEDRVVKPASLSWMQTQHLDGYVDAGNFRLHYLYEGKGEPVILLPGGGAWIYDFRDIIAALAPHYAVYAIDPPGDGYTTPLAKNPDYTRIYTLDSIDSSLLAFMNMLHIPRATFIGNSWGGGYALYFTEQHAERVSKYVSLDGEGLNLDDTGGTMTWELAKWPVLGEVEMKLSVTPDFARQYLEQLIPKMKTPTLIIWGKQDSLLLPHLYLPRWHQLAPRATIAEIDQAGHLVHEDQPELVNRLLLHFLGS
jgi:pimeloyl-ACP methyl ester carboxylesterase